MFEKVLDPSGYFQRMGCSMQTLRQAVGPVPEMIKSGKESFKVQVSNHCQIKKNSYWKFFPEDKMLRCEGLLPMYPYAGVLGDVENVFIFNKNLIVFTNALASCSDVYSEVYSIHPREINVCVSGGFPPR